MKPQQQGESLFQELHWTLVLAVFGVLAGQSSGAVSDGEVTIRLSPARARLQLSDTLEVELVVEGPAPLQVEPSSSWLTVASQRDWGVMTVGTHRLHSIGSQRERWVQHLRMEPFVPGTTQLIAFAPMRVNGREYPGPVLEVDVLTGVDPQKDKIGSVVWPAEEQDPAFTPPPQWTGWGWTGVLSAGLVLMGAAGLVWSCQRRSVRLSPRQWAWQKLGEWEYWLTRKWPQEYEVRTLGIGRIAAEVSAIVREYIRRRWGWPAPCWTTAELLAAATQAGWTIEQTQALERLLHECDRWRFRAEQRHDELRLRLLHDARAWLELVDPACPDRCSAAATASVATAASNDTGSC